MFTDAVTVNNTSVSSEVKDALVSNKPVVALETTIITHGMPYPQNLELVIFFNRKFFFNDQLKFLLLILPMINCASIDL